MPSAFQTKITGMSGLTGYWPLESGFGTAAAGGHNMTMIGNYDPNGTALVTGGGNATVFDGSTGYGSATSVPASNSFTILGWYRPNALPASGAPSILGMLENGNTITLGNTGRIRSGLAIFNVTDVLQVNKTYMLAITSNNNELSVYINGRWTRNYLSGPLTFGASGTFRVANAGHNAAIGHVAIFNRQLSSGELFELFKLGYTGTLPDFTDIFQLTNDGMDALGTINTAPGFNVNGQGYTVTSGSPRPSLTTAVSGHPVVKAVAAPIVGYCAGFICGGAIRSNEAYVKLADGRPIHMACKMIDKPITATPIIANIPTPTAAQYRNSYVRLLRDNIALKTIKTSGDGTSHAERGHYLSINEQDNTSGTAASAAAGMFTTYDTYAPGISQWHMYGVSTVSAATLHRYFDLPKNSWTRAYCETILDFTINQLQRSDGSFADGLGDDFFFPCFGMTIMLLGKYLDPAKAATWKASYLKLANQALGFGAGGSNGHGAALYCINGNRNLQNMFGIWMAYLITGDPKWQRCFEMQYKIFCGGMPAVGGFPAPPPAGTYATVPAPDIAGDWPTGGITNVWNGQQPAAPPSVPYGFTTTVEPSAEDGSDGLGYLGEAHGIQTPPDFDQNYSLYQLEILNAFLPWTGYDARLVYLTNMIFNSLYPYIDQTGNQILWADNNTAGKTPGSASNDPAWSLDAQGGSRAYGYAYEGFYVPIMQTLKNRNLRSSFPASTPAPAYANFGPITDAMCRSQYLVLENYYIGLQGATNMQPSYWRDMGKLIPSLLLNDSTFNLPLNFGS